MATVGIWKIEKRLDHVIGYATDVDKITNVDFESYWDIHQAIEYVSADYKTEEQFFVTGINCSVATAYEEMIITKRQYGKTDGIIGFHAFQSFKEGEVTKEQAHSIGIKLAEEMWGDRFEVIVSTHLNTKHFHNHFILNSVSFKDGKKYYDTRESYADLRELSNSICQEAGISYLNEKTCRKSGINYGNYYKSSVERSNYYTTTKDDIDRAILWAYSYKDFEQLLKNMDYDVHYRANKLTIRRSPYKKNIRVERCFGLDYTRESIEDRIKNTHSPRISFVEEYGINKNYNQYNNYKKEKAKGLYGLYSHYCYLLKVFPEKYPQKVISAEIRADAKRLDQITLETELLVKNKIETEEQFFLYKKKIETRLDELLSKRENLWVKHNKTKTDEVKEDIRIEINTLGEEISTLRKEVRLCNNTIRNIPKIEENLSKEYKEKGKELDEK